MFKINTDRTVETFEYSGLESLQKAVGGYIEAWYVPNPETGNVAVFWFNEEGKFEPLPLNEVATVLAYEYGDLPRDDYIVGPVVVTGQEGPGIAPLGRDWTEFFQRMIGSPNT